MSSNLIGSTCKYKNTTLLFNCHSQTETYCKSKNKSRSSDMKLKQYKERKYKENFCSCGEKIKNNSKRCNDCHKKSLRKVDRPSYEQLLDEINNFGYSKTGKKYGVSDNSIRKWKKQYEKNIEI